MPIKLSFIILLFIIFLSVSSFPFPKKLWLFWDAPIQSASLYIRLSFQKIKAICIESNWQLTLLSTKNLPQYIDNYQQNFQQIIKNAKIPFKQSISDLVRLSILQKYGGVYMDITTNLIYGLKWLEELEKYPHLIANKVDKVEPDMILFYNSLYQHTDQQRDPTTKTIINKKPGFEAWFIAAKPKAPAMTEWLKWFKIFYQMDFSQKQKIFAQDDIFFRNIQSFEYVNVDRSFYYVLQKKQAELDEKLNFLDIDKKQHAVNDYKIWGLVGQYGPYAFYSSLLKQQWSITKTLQQIQRQQFPIKFFVKTTHDSRQLLEKIFVVQKDMILNNITFQNIAQLKVVEQYINMTYQECAQIKFPIQGSVMAKLLENNQLAKQQGLFTITKDKQIKWDNFCQSLLKQQHQPTWIDIAQKASIQQSKQLSNLFFPNQQIQTIAKPHYLNLYENINRSQNYLYLNKLKSYYMANIAEISRIRYWLLFIVLLIVLYNAVLTKILKNIFIIPGDSNTSQKTLLCSSPLYKIFQQQKSSYQANPSIQNDSQTGQQIYFQSRNQNNLIRLFKFILIITLVISINLSYQLFDKYGVRNLSLWVLIGFVGGYKGIKRWIGNGKQNSLNGKEVQDLYITPSDLFKLFQPLILFGLGKLILSHIIIRISSLYVYSIYMCILLPYLIEKSKQNVVSSASQDKKHSNSISCLALSKYILTIYSWINEYLLIGFLLMCKFTNFESFRMFDQYIVRYLAWVGAAFCIILGFLNIFNSIQLIMNQIGSKSKSNKIKHNSFFVQYLYPIVKALDVLFIIIFFTYANMMRTRYFDFWLDRGGQIHLSRFIIIFFTIRTIMIQVQKTLFSQLSNIFQNQDHLFSYKKYVKPFFFMGYIVPLFFVIVLAFFHWVLIIFDICVGWTVIYMGWYLYCLALMMMVKMWKNQASKLVIDRRNFRKIQEQKENDNSILVEVEYEGTTSRNDCRYN